MKANSTEDNMVLSSRIRLARNFKDIPFPHKLDKESGREVVTSVEDALYNASPMRDSYKSIYLWQQDDNTSRGFVEKHLISPKLIANKEKAAFILDNKETVSIMVNEEDHIRLQTIAAGLNLEEAYDLTDKLDNLLEENIEYAFDEKLGYLTACPTNLGTGLRASVMIHLPALAINNEMDSVYNAVTKVGMTIRGLYGEGSRSEGNLFQISNQITLGLSEEDIINNLKAVVRQVINQENLSREQLLNKFRYELEDKIQRSVGILRSAVILDSKECLNLLSNVRLGVEMGIIKDINLALINSLLVETQPATLQQLANSKLGERERDISRAKYVREKLIREEF